MIEYSGGKVCCTDMLVMKPRCMHMSPKVLWPEWSEPSEAGVIM